MKIEIVIETFIFGRSKLLLNNKRLFEIRNNNNGTPMQIIAYRKQSDIDVKFLDRYDYIREHTTYSNFQRGQVKNPFDKTICNVGYIGDGEYLTGTARKHTVEYQNRTCMIRRCYDESLKERYSAYFRDCVVCDEWHNFQIFAKWYNDNIYQTGSERMHIDKDILIKGNKLYSPDTCLIVPQRINMLFLKKPNKYGLPNGVKKISNEKYESRYNGKYLGIFNSVEEAVMQHDIEKQNAVIKIANEYKGKIPNKVYIALINWKSN